MKLIIATHNDNKLKEMKEMAEPFGFEVKSLNELGLSEDIPENGESFSDNAAIKARAIFSKFSDSYVLADDSGLSVDCLGGMPGIHSARWMGRDTSYEIKNAAIIEKVNKAGCGRGASFICAMHLCEPGGEEFTALGEMKGEIALEAAGDNGFGYDPIFYIPSLKKTSAELSSEEKNSISHRGKALRRIISHLKMISENKK